MKARIFYLVANNNSMHKRDFIKQIGAVLALAPMAGYAGLGRQETVFADPETAPDTNFWQQIRADYELNPAYINLESGYYNIIPKPTLGKYVEHIREVNYQGSHYMRTVQWENKKKVASRLAKLVNCPENSLIITRNTTESLDMVISGQDWKPGDEAVFAIQDYGAMRDQFQLVADRYGVVNRVVSIPNHPADDEDIVSIYEKAITPKTRLLMVCHMINITGQILPIRKICDMAHRHGVDVMVDGAHCVGHIGVDLEALNCDYYGSSLHKWLATPLGAGILYVKKEKIPNLWPLLAEHDRERDDISRLNHTGTHPVHTDLAINNAIDYLEFIGIERKEARMRFLQQYWSQRARDIPNVVVNTPLAADRSCGIANVGITHLPPKKLAERLMKEHGIFTVAIDHANVQGCRVTPNVFTTTGELDALVTALETLARKS